MFKIYFSWIKKKKNFEGNRKKRCYVFNFKNLPDYIRFVYDHFCIENLKLIQKQVRIFNREIICTIPELGEFSEGYAYVYHILTPYMYINVH